VIANIHGARDFPSHAKIPPVTATAPAATTNLEVRPRKSWIGFLPAAQLAVGLVAAFTIIRLISAALVGLGVDEAYTLAIARHLQLSYFDHPPLHLWIVHALAPVLGYGRLARLPFIILFSGSCWLLFDLTRQLFGPNAALWALLALNLSGFFTVVASSWVLPDGPLIFCLLAAASELTRLIVAETGEAPGAARRAGAWLRVGLWIGLAGLSKYQAVFFAVGVGWFLVSTAAGRAWLGRPGPYLAALVAAATVSPVLVWNAQHQWASFAFQGGRAAPSHVLHSAAVLGALAGQMALLLPWIFAPLVLAGYGATRAGPADVRRWLCVTLSLPGIMIFAITPLWGQTSLPHWSMPAWLFLLPVMGDHLARAAAARRWPRIWTIASLSVLLAVWSLLLSDGATGWVGAAWPKTFPKGDPTLESVEWSPLAPAPEVTDLLGRPGSFVVSMKWNEAGRIVSAIGDRAPVVVLSDDPRGFAETHPSASLIGHDALIVVKPEDLADGLNRVGRCFERIDPLQVVRLGRQGRPELELHLFGGHHFSEACSQIGLRGFVARSQWAALKAHRPAVSAPAPPRGLRFRQWARLAQAVGIRSTHP
jgi:hypothetical protein